MHMPQQLQSAAHHVNHSSVKVWFCMSTIDGDRQSQGEIDQLSPLHTLSHPLVQLCPCRSETVSWVRRSVGLYRIWLHQQQLGRSAAYIVLVTHRGEYRALCALGCFGRILVLSCTTSGTVGGVAILAGLTSPMVFTSLLTCRQVAANCLLHVSVNIDACWHAAADALLP